MKVAAYYSNKDVQIKEMSVPKIGDDDILMEVESSGICGSDLMEEHRKEKIEALRKQNKFLVPGHEISGKIVEIGKNVSDKYGYLAGDRIFATHHVPCDKCRPCKRGYPTQCKEFKEINNFSPGGMAEYIKVSGRSVEKGVIRLNDEMTYDHASFIEPLGTVVEMAVVLEDRFRRDDSVLVLGCGVAGILNIQYARQNGVEKIFATDINEFRMKKAGELGADYVFNAQEYSPDKLRELNQGRLADLVIVCAGNISAIEQAFQSYEQGGKIIQFAIPPKKEEHNVNWYEHCRNGYTIKPTYGASPEACYRAFEIIRDKKINVDDMITHRFPLEDAAVGFELASKGKECLKVIIKPQRNRYA